jgi:hypothetical protein
VRILTQESQKGKPAQELAKKKPNVMINGHQDWLDGLVAAALKEETLSGNDVYGVCWRAARNVVRRQHLKTAAKAGQ